MVDLAVVSELGTGTDGVLEASMLTLTFEMDGAVHASALQSQEVTCRVTDTVLAELPELLDQEAIVTSIVKVAVTSDVIWEGY